MADRKEIFGSATNITITLANLLASAARESTAIDNTSDLFNDAMVYLALKFTVGTPGARVNVYVYGSEDGTNYDDNATGSDAAITLRSPSNLKYLGGIFTPTSGALTYKKIFPSVAQAFGGYLPAKWGIVVLNSTALSLDATEGNHTKQYRGIYATRS